MGVGDGVVLVISVTLILALVRCGCNRIPNGGEMRLLQINEVFKGGYSDLVITRVMRVRKNADGKGETDLGTSEMEG